MDIRSERHLPTVAACALDTSLVCCSPPSRLAVADRRLRRRRRRRRPPTRPSRATPRPTTGTAETSGETLTLGYSAWPGWFPLAVAEEAGIFEEVGLDVDLRFFADYLGSLDAMAAGELDGNTQTLNDTMFASPPAASR